MSRLFSDLTDGSGRQFFSALTGAPGFITPAPAALTLQGRAPIAVEPQTIFRTPTPALVTLNGLGFFAPSTVIPAPAALASVGQIPVEVLALTISPALPSPVESPPNQFVPTLLTFQTVAPDTAALSLQTREIAVTQGGNIGFVAPAAAQLTFGTLQYTLTYGEAGVGSLLILGQAPEIVATETVLRPDVGQIVMANPAPALALPFGWVDDDPAPPSIWITDVAA